MRVPPLPFAGLVAGGPLLRDAGDVESGVPMSPSFEDDPLIGVVIAGRYRIHRVLGEGGAGRVYAAVQEAMGREVAVKMLRWDVRGDVRREYSTRFAREAELLGRLSHPNVVTVHDYGVAENGDQFVVMELLRGQSLKDIVRDGPLDAVRASRLAEGVARGLAHAHEAGLVHRDIKPSNIHVVVDGDGHERPVILDFGLVKGRENDDDVTRTGTYMGTPAYTAPEQARGDPNIDHRADIYAWGVLLYRMLAGVVPYQGANPMGTVILHITEPYPPISKTAPGVVIDPLLEDVVRRAMEKVPANRWHNASLIAKSLAAWRDGELEPPTPESSPSGWAMPLLGGLGAGLAGLGLGVASLLVFLGIGALWWFSQAAPAVAVATPPAVVAVVAPEPVVPPPVAPIAVSSQVAEPSAKPIEAAPPKKAVIAEKKAVKEVPVAAPEPTPKPAKTVVEPDVTASLAPVDPLLVDNVHFTDAGHAARAIKFANEASEQQLRDAHVYDKGVMIIIANRPFADVAAFGATPGIGEATVRAIANAGK